MKGRHFLAEKPLALVVLLAGLIGSVWLIFGFFRISESPNSCSQTGFRGRSRSSYSVEPIQLKALLHYATSTVVPQQSFGEISISFAVLQNLAPCNFLVFGCGHDSMMWAAFNAGGKTLFLEEDPKWVQTVLKDAPDLRAHHVSYRTKVAEADELLSSYRSVRDCSTSKSELRGNEKCKLALTGLPDKFYDTEWDLIMIDGPRGYFAAAPGRMGAIYSAAVMARNRKRPGVTHVFLHNVDRKVEKMYAEEFLCRKYLVNGSGRLWHFEIPPAANMTHRRGSKWFC